ncbi:MAG: leucyl aminopeptidase, partial [Parcubacteria group bacterium]
VFKNKLDEGFTLVKLSEEKTAYFEVKGKQKTLIIGIGKFKDITQRKSFLVVRRVIAEARKYRLKNIGIDFKDFKFKHLKIKDADLGELIGANMTMANYEFVNFKKEPKEGWDFIEDLIVMNTNDLIAKAFKKGQIIGVEVNNCRDLANMPAGDMTPEILTEEAKLVSKGTKVNVKALDVDDMKILKMGGVLGVGQGSKNEPRFIILEYYGTKKTEKPILLVGKGVTYDTGGINLKPSQGGLLNEMHMDMAGGAAVIHTVITASLLKIKKNVIGLVPAVENMPSGSSYKPSDVLRSMSGQTIEVINTDAEGRIILADALTYAEKYKPKLVIDIATLTGAAIAGLGQKAMAIFTKDEKIEKKMRDLGEETGDYMWPLPLWEEYEEDIKGTFGDWANLGKIPSFAGAITAAMFLYQFAKNYPWVHLDIAPTMTTIEGQYLAKGASGSPVKLLVKLLETFK